MGSGKEDIEVCPHLVGKRRPLSVFAVLDEHSCLKDELECVGYDLEWGVGIVARIRIFDGILGFFEQPFDGLIHIVGCLEAGVVIDELVGGDVGIHRVQIWEHLVGGDVGISDIAGSDSTEEDVIDSTDEEIFKCLVGVVVFFEYFLVLVVCLAGGGRLQGRRGGGDCRSGTGVRWRNEESGR